VLMMRKWDEDYARDALRWYHATLPDWDLMRGVAEALKNEPARRNPIPAHPSGKAARA
jgi:negative regulator of sigma E activity